MFLFVFNQAKFVDPGTCRATVGVVGNEDNMEKRKHSKAGRWKVSSNSSWFCNEPE